MEFNIKGKHATARIHTSEENIDDYCRRQIQSIVDHPLSENKVEIMPDAHGGAGAVIGYTTKMGDKISPNTTGVDVGCGMTAMRLACVDADFTDNEEMNEVDDEIRKNVPMGRSTFADTPVEQEYHLVDDFPWETCEDKLSTLNASWDGGEIESPEYGEEYFKELCRRVEYSPMRAINSLGTLGGGNHFIEVSKSDKNGDVWVVVHSGSRGIGHAIAEYWQEKAHQECDDRANVIRERLSEYPEQYYKMDLSVEDGELLNWVLGGKGEDFKNMDAIVEDYHNSNPEKIEEIKEEMKEIAIYAEETSQADDLDYLSGDSRKGYLKDMIFAQTYAAESRRLMATAVANALNAQIEQKIVSTHNYIDFEDTIIRKGATRVHEDELAIIPFNMKDGAIIVRGKGNEAWNKSAPHGAGRRGSRRWAYGQFDLEGFKEQMEGVFSTSVTQETLDEHPKAYKNPNVILENIEETAEIVDTLTPLMNLKAEE